MTREEAVAQWTAEAAEKITVGGVGSHRMVLVDGIKVAEFATFGALVTEFTLVTDRPSLARLNIDDVAEAYAEQLRGAYVALALGDGSQFA